MSNYISSLLSKSLTQTEIIRPRLPSLFEPISIPYISRSGKRWDSEENESNVGWNTEIKKPLSEFKGEVSPASEFLEKRKNQSKHTSPKEFKMGIEDVPTESKPLQQETSALESTWIKPTRPDISQSKFSRSEITPSKPAYGQGLSLFKSSGYIKEKEPLDLESKLKLIPNQTFYQNNANGVRTPRNIPYFMRQNQRFNRDTTTGENVNIVRQFMGQYASKQYSSDKNSFPKESNLAPTSTSIVPKLLENEAVIHSRPLKNAGSVIVPDSVWDTRTRDEVEQPVIRISIGRIEVKAVTQTPLSQKRENKPQAPKLSLDSYLNSRNGGKI